MSDTNPRRFCPECGQPVSSTAKFCRNCGHKLPPAPTEATFSDARGQGASPSPDSMARGAAPEPAWTPAPQPGTAPVAQPEDVPGPGPDGEPERAHRGVVLGIVIACVAGAIAIGLIGWWFFAANAGPAQVTVPITINAEGYSDECTAIPIQVEGTDEGGGTVSETAFVGGGESDLSLQPGTYTLTFPASPLTPSGIVYNLPEGPLTIVIVLGEDGAPQISGNEAVTFTPSTALDQTDEMIQTAYEWALKDPDQKERAEELHEKALQVHKEAVDQKNAEDEAKRQEEEAARQAEEERQRQEEEARQAADPLNQIQGSWSGSIISLIDRTTVYGTMSVDISGNRATFYEDGQTWGPYTIYPMDNQPEADYEMSFPTTEHTKFWLMYSPSDPSTLACALGSDATEVGIMSRS